MYCLCWRRVGYVARTRINRCPSGCWDCRQIVDKPFVSIGTIGILNRLEGRFLSCFESNGPQ
jgi:hypothetical protein